MPKFVVHEHHATHLHWDFRLEKDGVLVSWAVPKGVPTEPGVKRLAIRVEDHPLEYGSFEGEIPEGQYGAGKVIIWDEGEYFEEKWTKTKITFRMAGEKCAGTYILYNMKENQWLLWKMKESKSS